MHRGNILPFALVLLTLAVIIPVGMLVFKPSKLAPLTKNLQSAPSTTDETVYTEESRSANWKTFSMDEISFKYPPNWKDPEITDSRLGQVGHIYSTDNSQRLVILSGINRNNTEQELSDFLNSFEEGGGEKLVLDGSEAVILRPGDFAYQGSKIIAVYVTSKDKKYQHSISLEYRENIPNDEMDRLIDQILSTFKFLDENQTVCAQVITPARNPQTGECKEFSTPCDVPEGWDKMNSCSQKCPTPPKCLSPIIYGDPNPSDPNQCPRYQCSQ